MKNMRKFLTLVVCMLLIMASMMVTVQADTVAEDVKDARNGVLQINLVYTEDNGTKTVVGGGSAFLINDDTLVTCYHVVHLEDQESNYARALEYFGQGFDLKKISVDVIVKNDLTLTARLKQESQAADFAILVMEQPIYNRTPLKLNDNSRLSETQQVYALGFPDAVASFQNQNSYISEDVTISDGRITKTTTQDGVKFVQHSAALRTGTSGGPLVAEDGSVVALNTGYLDEYNYSVDISEIRDALDALGISYTNKETGSGSTDVDVEEPTDSKIETPSEKVDDKEEETEEVTRAQKPTVSSDDYEDEDEEDADEEEGLNKGLIIAIIAVVAVVIIIIIILIVALSGKKSKNGVNGGMPPINTPPYSPMGGNQSPMGGNQPPMGGVQPPRTMTPSQSGQYYDEGGSATTVLNEGAGETTVLGGGSQAVSSVVIRVKTGERILVNRPEFSLGKERSRVDYCISNNNSISRVHAKLVNRGGQLFLIDLNATNGTFVNGTKLSPGQEARLSVGDRFKLADEEFQVQA